MLAFSIFWLFITFQASSTMHNKEFFMKRVQKETIFESTVNGRIFIVLWTKTMQTSDAIHEVLTVS